MTKVKWLCLMALGALVVVSLQPANALPPAGYDDLETTAEVHLYDPGDPDTYLETIIMSGYAIVYRGDPYDPGDGRMTVETRIEELYLKGYSQYLGDTAHVTLNPAMGPAVGTITQVTPGIDFPAESFFDVYYRITLGDHPPDPTAKSASARGSFGYDPESKTARADITATAPAKPSAEELIIEKIVGPATEINLGQADKGVMDWCEHQWQGDAAYYITGWFAGNEYYAAYQDPGDVCTDAYPFEVSEFHFMIQTHGSVSFGLQGYVYEISGPPACPKPGAVICESQLHNLNAPDAGTWVTHIPFDAGCCVYGPYFVGIWIDTDDPDLIDIIVDAGPGDTCKTYNDYGPGWTDLTDYFDYNLLLWSGGYTAPQNNCSQVLINVDSAHMRDTIWQIPPDGRVYQDPRKIPLIDPVTGAIITYAWHKHKVNPPDSGRDTIPTTGRMDIVLGYTEPAPDQTPDETIHLNGTTILRWGEVVDPGTGQEVETELVAMDLTGESQLFGLAVLRLNPDELPSLGKATSVSEDEFWPVESFFDVYYEVEFPALGQTIIPSPRYEPPHMVSDTPIESFPPEDITYSPDPEWHQVIEKGDLTNRTIGWVRPYHIIPPPPPPVLGACCNLATGACRMVDANSCNLPNERYEGDGTSCTPNPCPQPAIGACCDLVTGACRETTANDCNGLNEQYQSDGTSCDPNPCPQPQIGACCDTLTGGCRQTAARDCIGPGEIYMGDGIPCEPNPCPTPSEPDTCEYYKPGYIDYCPNGMPDFDQRQNAWTDPSSGKWSHCGPVALANCLWWFDSKFETSPVDPIITPGLNDHYPLVQTYEPTGGTWDDHDPNNVVPLVDSMALYCNTNVGGSGTNVFNLATGAQNWINNAGLGSGYTVRVKAIEPDWGYDSIKAEVLRSQDVILLIGFWQEMTEGYCERVGGHFVTAAGVCTDDVDSALCISDPIRDKNEGAGHADPTVHNDASLVSGPHGTMHHDRYDVAPTPCVRFSAPWFHLEFPGYQAGLPTQQLFYGMNSFDDTQPVDPSEQYPVHTIIEYAVIICPVEAQQGACCDTINGTCRETTQADCNGQDEEYQGDGTLCSQITCPSVTGACCFTDGSCINTTESDCVGQSGTYLGDGTACLGDHDGVPGDDACDDPIGACCLDDGTCLSNVSPADCYLQGGYYLGDGSVCLDDNDGNGVDDACEGAPQQKWFQEPDLSTEGMDVSAYAHEQYEDYVLATDFECTSPTPIVEVHVFGSWYQDKLPYDDPSRVSFVLSLHEDIPDPDGEGPEYSMPGARICHIPDPAFDVRIHEANLDEGWLEPPDSYEANGDRVCWEYIFYLDGSCVQEGTVDNPIIYWLDVQAYPEDPDAFFGWKTAVPPHWNDDACWAYGVDAPGGPTLNWNELVLGGGGYPYVPGDINGDGDVNSDDVDYFYDFIYIGGPHPVYEVNGFYPASDVNGNCQDLEIQDYVALSSYVSTGSPPLSYCETYPPALPAVSLDLAMAIYGGPVTGACCDTITGGCRETTPADCNGQDEQYQGDGTLCSQITCPSVTGACCDTITGGCRETTPADCNGQDEQYQGHNILCSQITCASQEQQGACCITEVIGEDTVTRCAVLTESDCQTQLGEYMGNGTECLGDHNGNGIDDACEDITWDPEDRHKMHFPQLPDEAGWDVMATSPITLADDWRCMKTGWVRDVHFWGSWKGGIPGEIAAFRLSIHEDIPADPPSFHSRPGALLWERTIGTFLATPKDPPTREGWFNPAGDVVIEDDHQAYFQYDIILDSLDWFWQDSSIIYWLDISAIVEPGPVPVLWGWKSSLDHFNDNAVFQLPTGLEWYELRDPMGQVDDRLNLSFVITGSCCSWPTMGDADCNLEGPDIGDVTYMIRLLFITVGAPWCCFDEADLDVNGDIDIGDLTILINRLFINLRPVDPCP